MMVTVASLARFAAQISLAVGADNVKNLPAPRPGCDVLVTRPMFFRGARRGRAGPHPLEEGTRQAGRAWKPGWDHLLARRGDRSPPLGGGKNLLDDADRGREN